MPGQARPSKRRRSSPADAPAAAKAQPASTPRPPKSITKAATASARAPAASITKHVLSCIDWPVSGAAAVAVSPDGCVLATGRADGAVELRAVAPGSVKPSPASAVRAPAVPRGGVDGALAVSALVFASDGVLVAGRMDGSVEIYDVVERCFLEERCRMEVPGGAVWDLAVHGGRVIAVACDDRYVRLLSALDSSGQPFPKDPVAYAIKTLARGTSRVLCVAFLNGSGQTVVSGDGKGNLRWLNAASGQCFATGRLRGDVRIWSLAVARGGQEVFAGDSTGRVSRWDARTGTLFDEVHLDGMEGDIMALAHVASDGPNLGETVLVGSASGAVGALVSGPTMGARWVPIRPRRLHSHDVRSLAVVQSPGRRGVSSFVTASLDTTMAVVPVASLVHDDKLEPLRIRPFASPSVQPHVQFIPRQNAVVARYPSWVDLWRVNISAAPTMLWRLSLSSLAPNIRLCAVSDALRVVAVATPTAARVFHVSPVRGEGVPFSAKITPVACVRTGDLPTRGDKARIGGGVAVHDALVNAVDMAFMGKKQFLVAIRAGAQSVAVCSGLAPQKHGKDDSVSVAPSVQDVSMEDLGCARGTRQLIRVVASGGKLARCAVSDSSGRVAVLEVPGDGPDGKPAAPSVLRSIIVKGTILGMAFSHDGSQLAVTSSQRKGVVIDVLSGRKSMLHIPSKYWSSSTCLSFAPNSQAVVLSGHSHCIVAPVVPWNGERKETGQAGEQVEEKHGGSQQVEEGASGKAEAERPSKRSRRSSSWRVKLEEAANREVHKHLGFHENILGTCVLGNGEVVVVNRPWDMVVPMLPRAMKRKVFGS